MERIIAITPAPGQSVKELHSGLIRGYEMSGIRYFHIGLGKLAIYTALPEEISLKAVSEVAARCNAEMVGSGYLLLKHVAESDSATLETALERHPIDYDLPIRSHQEVAYLVCGQCGGVGKHISPPCTLQNTVE